MDITSWRSCLLAGLLSLSCAGDGPGAPDVTDPAVGVWNGLSVNGAEYPVKYLFPGGEVLVIRSSTLSLAVDGRFTHTCDLHRTSAGVERIESCLWAGSWVRTGRTGLRITGDSSRGHGISVTIRGDTLTYTGDGGVEIYAR